MNFIIFNILLLVAVFPAAIILGIGVMLIMLPFTPLLKSDSPPKIVLIPTMVVAGAYQSLFLGFMGCICVGVTTKYIQKPDVTWDWLYWICGFMWCTSLLGWLLQKEQQTITSTQEARSVDTGAMIYSLITIAAFLIFAFVPNLVEWPYGWFMNLTGLSIAR